MLKRLLLAGWYLLATLLVSAALALSVARMAVPWLGEQKSSLESALGSRLGQQVRIDGMDADWHGLHPQLRLLGVEVLDRETDASLLRIGELRVGLNVWRSLRHGTLSPAGISIVDTHLALRRGPDGRITLDGFSPRTPLQNPLELLLQQPRLQLLDSQVEWLDANAQQPLMLFTDVDLQLRSAGHRHQVNGEVTLPEHLGRRLQVAADLRGQVGALDSWRGDLFVSGEQLHAGAWSERWRPRHLHLEGTANLTLWGQLWQGELVDLRGTLESEDALLRPVQTGHEPLAVQGLRARFGWRRDDDDWRLDVADFTLRQNGRLWPSSNFVVAHTPAQRRWQLRAGHLDLAVLQHLGGRIAPLSARNRALLAAMEPAGMIRNLQMELTSAEGKISRYGLRADFFKLHTHAHERLPGFDGLSGTLYASSMGGQLRLSGDAGRIELPQLLREPINFDQLGGIVHWQPLDASRWRIHSAGLRLENKDIALQTRLQVDTGAELRDAHLNLQAHVSRADLAAIRHYLPAKRMREKPVRWLDRALVAGRVTSAALSWHGQIGDYPFANGEGRFQALVNVEDGVLDYRDGWHRAEQIDARLTFENRSLSIHAVGGRMLDGELAPVHARIDDFKQPVLQLEGNATGQLAELWRVFAESPLGERYTQRLGPLSADGAATLQLGLQIPLRKDLAPLRVNGQVRLADNRIGFDKWKLDFTNLDGSLAFTEQHLASENLRGRLDGGAVRIKIKPGRTGTTHTTDVRVTGKLDLLRRARDKQPALLRSVQGSSEWEALLSIPKLARDGSTVKPVTLQFESDLRGIHIALPEPYAKSSTQARNLRIAGQLARSDSSVWNVSYADRASASLRFDGKAGAMRLRRGEVRLDATAPVLPDGDELRIAGRMAHFDFEQWKPWFEAPAKGAAAPGPQLVLKTQFDDLDLLGHRFRALSVDARREDRLWIAQIGGEDAAGTLALPRDFSAEETLELHLRRLRLNRIPDSAADSKATMKPQDLPSMSVSIDALDLHGRALGEMRMSTRRGQDRMQIEELAIANSRFNLNAKGEWMHYSAGHRTHLDARLETEDLGALMRSFGYAGSLRGGVSSADLSAHWRGTPMQFSLPALEGSLDLSIGAGTVVDVEPGAGRIFGLLNLHSLPRRLTLDFSDLFDEGFGFDSIKGNFSLSAGNAYTDDLVVDAPSARIEISGRTGLQTRDYDQLVTVIPNVSSSLPIAGALAGGPAVGAALLIADQLLRGPLGELTEFTHTSYTVNGPWDKPRFQRFTPLPPDRAQSDEPQYRSEP